MSKKRIDSYFKRSRVEDGGSHNINVDDVPPENPNILETQVEHQDSPKRKIQRIDEVQNTQRIDEVQNMKLERDPGKRQMIWNYTQDKMDEVCRFDAVKGHYQVNPKKDPKLVDRHGRKFLSSWYKPFAYWLEYSPIKNVAFCHKCYLFAKPSTGFGSNAFVVGGFQSWKKVNEGKNCAFLLHEGHGPNSIHKVAVKKYEDMLNSLQHIDKIWNRQSSELMAKNRLRLKVSVDVAKLCAFQAITFRSHDESFYSCNRGNFLEIVEHTTSYNKEVDSCVLKNAPLNATYISPDIQKEILSIYASRIQRFIREEIGDEKSCIIVDESRDESKREQMAIILRFVDKGGFVQERFFDIVHVEDTRSSTLKKAICDVLSHHKLSTHNIRGQGYDGASNMRGEWNGLQALFLNEL